MYLNLISQESLDETLACLQLFQCIFLYGQLDVTDESLKSLYGQVYEKYNLLFAFNMI